jgi:hypothetical protein
MRDRERTTARGGQPSTTLPARELYLQEKARRAKRVTEIDERLAAAQREYDELLASQAAAGRGGRPKKVVQGGPHARKRTG